MRKVVPLLSFVSLLSVAQAQDVPNGDFENWVSQEAPITHVMYEDPAEWTTFNDLLAFFNYPITATKYEVSAKGNFSLQLMTAAYDKVGGGLDTTAGFATISFAVNKKPLLLNGFYMSYLKGEKDTVGILFSATKKNNSGTSDVVGFGAVIVTSTQSTFTDFSVPFNYATLDAMPDSVHIVMSSGGKKINQTSGTTFWVDGLSITYKDIALGLGDVLDPASAISVYPNPVKGTLFMSNLPKEVHSYRILTVQGQEISSGPISSALPQLSTEGMPKGMHILELYQADNALVGKKKVVLEGN